MNLYDRTWAASLSLALLIGAGGCSLMSASGRQCRMWQSSGTVISTLDSCVQCVDQLGTNPDAVRGCAVGLDAAALINSGRAAPR